MRRKDIYWNAGSFIYRSSKALDVATKKAAFNLFQPLISNASPLTSLFGVKRQFISRPSLLLRKARIMIKSAAQCLLFAIVHEIVCKDAVKKALLFPLYVQQSFVFDPCFFWIFEFRYAVLMYVDDSTSQMPKKA